MLSTAAYLPLCCGFTIRLLDSTAVRLLMEVANHRRADMFTYLLRPRCSSPHTSWRRSIVVRMLVSAGELSLSCARLLAGWVTTLLLSRPLSISQHGQLSHPSLRGR